MGSSRHALLMLVILALGAFQLAQTSTPHSLDQPAHDNDIKENLLLDNESAEADTLLPQHAHTGIKISTPKVKEVPVTSTSTSSSSSTSTSTTTSTSTSTSTAATTKSAKKPAASKPTTAAGGHHQGVSDEILNDLIEASKHSAALADDPRFNKLLPDKFKTENSTLNGNKSEENYYDYDSEDYDDDDYNYDDETTTAGPSAKKSKAATTATNKPDAAKSGKKVEMKPIKEEKESTSKSKSAVKGADKKQQQPKNNEDLDDDDYDEDDDDDDDDDDIADEEEVMFSQNVPCPRYCECARNVNSYLVATCSRFDPETQKFGSDITDLIVADVGPKYPILLGPEFFLQMGLKYVSSIKISNCTIEFLHPEAFHGLDELYSVNLTNVGLAVINPNTFSKNKKLRLLTISGNDLSVMYNVPFLLNSSSIEELDLSRNNLMELRPQAFSQLANIVYINLSQNNLQKLPEKVFDTVETIEELDLSYNALKTLPPTVFNRTALAILHLKYNSITGDLHFGTEDLQQLDLSFNNIKQIHHGMFDKMTGLTNLNLKGNGITKIQADSFLALKNLRHIDLSINELDQVSSMLFYKNSELDVIRLNDNPRLSQLPTDGFLSYNGFFTVYFLDISNCAIGALGHKTFSTMPHLATLKLAWNNINNLERDTFASLTKLTDLDLSNNLVARLDELIFMNNNEMSKLNLAGNPIRKLSVRLFLPLGKLRELDVSDCELASLMSENQYGVGRKYKFFETLRSFNASANQIKRISSADVRNFKNLRTLDISNNPLKCNEDFQDFISYVSLNTKMMTNKVPVLANLEADATIVEEQSDAGWAELAHEVCRHQDGMWHKTKTSETLEKRIEQANKELDNDAKSLWNIVESTKNYKQKILKDADKSEVLIAGSLDEENANEGDANNAEEEKDGEDDNASEYDEDEEDDEDDDDDDDDNNKNNEDELKKVVDKIHDFGVKVQEVDITKETRDPYLLHKFLLNGDETNDNSEEEIIIERGHIYYEGYRFLIPVIAIVTCVLVLLLIIAKMVTIVLRKRGERYRMALLASSNNSIVYQKLSEEIKPKAKEIKQPKVHRYTPINQV